MAFVKVDPRFQTNGTPRLEIQCEVGGPTYTFEGGQIAEVNNPRELARICQIPGVSIVDNTPTPRPEPTPSRGPGRPRKFPRD